MPKKMARKAALQGLEQIVESTAQDPPLPSVPSREEETATDLSSAQSDPSVVAMTEAARFRLSIKASSPKDGFKDSRGCRSQGAVVSTRRRKLPGALDAASYLVHVHHIPSPLRQLGVILGHPHLEGARFYNIEPAAEPACKPALSGAKRTSQKTHPRQHEWEP